MTQFKVIWSTGARQQLKRIYDYIKYEKKSPQGAHNVKRDILDAPKSIKFPEQFQKDDIKP